MIGSRPRRRLRLLALFAALAAAVLALAACGSSSSSSSTSASAESSSSSEEASGPFKVLVIWPRSGPLKLSGDEELAGLEAAVEKVNGEGGILGSKVELTVKDDAGEGDKAVSIAQEELASEPEKFNLIIPGINGLDAIPLASQLAANPTLQITTAAEEQLDDPGKYPNLYSSLNSFVPNAEGVMEELKKEGISKVAFISGANPSAESAQHKMEEQAQKSGITITTSVLVPEEAPDVTAQMQKALATKPEALISGAFTLAAPAILKARTKLAPTMPWFCDTFFDALNYGEFASNAELKGIKFESFPFLVKGDPSQKEPWYTEFSAAVKKFVPKPAIAQISQVVSYNALMIARAAAEKAESTDGSKMAEVMGEVTKASEVPDFVGGSETGIFTPEQHIINVKGKDLIFTNAGPQEAGLLVPLP